MMETNYTKIKRYANCTIYFSCMHMNRPSNSIATHQDFYDYPMSKRYKLTQKKKKTFSLSKVRYRHQSKMFLKTYDTQENVEIS